MAVSQAEKQIGELKLQLPKPHLKVAGIIIAKTCLRDGAPEAPPRARAFQEVPQWC